MRRWKVPLASNNYIFITFPESIGVGNPEMRTVLLLSKNPANLFSLVWCLSYLFLPEHSPKPDTRNSVEWSQLRWFWASDARHRARQVQREAAHCREQIRAVLKVGGVKRLTLPTFNKALRCPRSPVEAIDCIFKKGLKVFASFVEHMWSHV